MRYTNFDRSDLNPFEYSDSERDLDGEEQGDDFLIVGEVSMHEHVRELIPGGVCNHNLIGVKVRETSTFSQASKSRWHLILVALCWTSLAWDKQNHQ